MPELVVKYLNRPATNDKFPRNKLTSLHISLIFLSRLLKIYRVLRKSCQRYVIYFSISDGWHELWKRSRKWQNFRTILYKQFNLSSRSVIWFFKYISSRKIKKINKPRHFRNVYICTVLSSSWSRIFVSCSFLFISVEQLEQTLLNLEIDCLYFGNYWIVLTQDCCRKIMEVPRDRFIKLCEKSWSQKWFSADHRLIMRLLCVLRPLV